MHTTTTNATAILRGEQRSNRFRYRHSVAEAAREVGIPASWIWSWLLAKQLRSVTSLRCVWVRLEDVQKLFADIFAVRAAYFATGEHLTSPQAIQAVVDRWPDSDVRPYIKFQPPVRTLTLRNQSDLPVPDHILCEGKESKVAG